MELILINPPQPYLVEKHTQTPLGILYISAVVKRDRPDVDVSVCDLSDCSEPIEVPDADVYGYSYSSCGCITSGVCQ